MGNKPETRNLSVFQAGSELQWSFLNKPRPFHLAPSQFHSGRSLRGLPGPGFSCYADAGSPIQADSILSLSKELQGALRHRSPVALGSRVHQHLASIR